MAHDDWHLFYSKPVTFKGALGAWMYHWPYLLQVRKETRVSALEVGCGRGVHSTFLSYSVPKVVGLDSNAELVVKARKQNSRLLGRAKFVHDNAFNLSFPKGSFDTSFSQGFFEHFSDKDICVLMEKQLSLAKTVVASVPSGYLPNRDKGDERLMLMENWRKILKNYNTKMFYYGCYYTNLGDLKKVVMSKHYRMQLCMVVKKTSN